MRDPRPYDERVVAAVKAELKRTTAICKARGRELIEARETNAELVAALDRLTFAFGQKEKRGDDYLILAHARAVIAKARA